MQVEKVRVRDVRLLHCECAADTSADDHTHKKEFEEDEEDPACAA